MFSILPNSSVTDVGRNYWADATNRQQYLLQLKEQLGGTWASLYKLSPSLLAWTGGMHSLYPHALLLPILRL